MRHDYLLRDAFILPKYHSGTDEYDDPLVLIPEVSEWCKNTFGRIPTVYFDPFIRDNDTLGLDRWIISFRSEQEAISFKLRWTGYGL